MATVYPDPGILPMKITTHLDLTRSSRAFVKKNLQERPLECEQHAQTKESLKALEAVSAMAAVYPNPGILSTKITTRLGPTSDRAIAVIAITIAVIDF